MTRLNQAGRSNGFTLLELVLVVALLMLMVTSVGFYVGPWLTGAGVEAQASQVAGALRFARAEAAHLGRTVRLSFEPEPIEAARTSTADSGQSVRYRLTVSYEAQPLREPFAFVPLTGRAWVEQLEELDLIMITQVQLIGPDAQALAELTDPDADDNPQSRPVHLLFYPNGSTESAELVVAPVNPRDHRRGIVTLYGLTGNIHLAWTDVQGLLDDEDELVNPFEPDDDDEA